MHRTATLDQRQRRLSSCDLDRPEADDEAGLGWFESSLDLTLGLQITEGDGTFAAACDTERSAVPLPLLYPCREGRSPRARVT